MDVAPRAWLVAPLTALATLMLPAVTDPDPALGTRRVGAPGARSLPGRCLQQTRPGVPGRTRSRAPGCGR